MDSDSRFSTCQGRNTASSSLDKEYQWHIIYIIKEIKVPEFTSLDVPPKKVESASALLQPMVTHANAEGTTDE